MLLLFNQKYSPMSDFVLALANQNSKQPLQYKTLFKYRQSLFSCFEQMSMVAPALEMIF